MDRIDADSGSPIVGNYVGEWPHEENVHVVYDGEYVFYWQRPDGLYEYWGELSEDEAHEAMFM